MKTAKKLILSAIVMVAIVLVISAYNFPAINTPGEKINPPQEKVVSPFPENVAKVLETSCFDCHGGTSSNEKALAKIDFSKWNDLSNAKKVGKMQDMIDMLNKGEMPPEKYVAKFPDRAPGKEQKDIIIKWATGESDKLMGN